MKPQLIRGEDLTYQQQRDVIAWLKRHGCAWMIPYAATIQITGQHFTVETWTIRNQHQARTLWPRRIPHSGTPTKLRKYRIRHELRWTK